MLIVVIMGKCVLSCPRCPVIQCVRHRGDIYLVMKFVVMWCFALWLMCLCLVLCGPSC